MIYPCAGCGAKNRVIEVKGEKLPPKFRCGRCKREFTSKDVIKAMLMEMIPPDLKAHMGAQ